MALPVLLVLKVGGVLMRWKRVGDLHYIVELREFAAHPTPMAAGGRGRLPVGGRLCPTSELFQHVVMCCEVTTMITHATRSSYLLRLARC